MPRGGMIGSLRRSERLGDHSFCQISLYQNEVRHPVILIDLESRVSFYNRLVGHTGVHQMT